MPRTSISEVLQERDGLTKEEADEQVHEARGRFKELLEEGNIMELDDFCLDEFGLEPDYMDEFLYG